MRKLGQGQSVVFCVPEEIGRQLRSRATVPEHMRIGVSDVLCWTVTQTWMDVRRSMPLWAVQGRRFEGQQGLWTRAYSDGELSLSTSDAELFLEDEAQTLKHRYQPRVDTDTRPSPQTKRGVNLQRIEDRCRQFHILEHATATLQEEQERELSPEIVQQREVQRPLPAKPADHSIHPDLRAFVIDGTLKSGSDAFKPAFETLRQTNAASHIDVSQFPVDVLATADFASTIQSSSQSSLLDSYQRPVQWVVTSIGKGTDNVIRHLVIISPFEAEMLLADIRRSTKVILHLYAPRPNLGIRPIDQLDLYRISAIPTPPSLPRKFVTQLNLFAGQLYVDSFTEYVEVCNTLGLAWQEAEEGSTIAADGFIIRMCNGPLNHASGFVDSPVMFLRVLLTKIRKNCEEISKTHMGAILGGRLLPPSDFGVESAR